MAMPPGDMVPFTEDLHEEAMKRSRNAGHFGDSPRVPPITSRPSDKFSENYERIFGHE